MAREDPKLMVKILTQLEGVASVARMPPITIPGYDQQDVLEHIVLAYDRQYINGSEVAVYGEPRSVIPTALLPAGRDFLKAERSNTVGRKLRGFLGKMFMLLGVPALKKLLNLP